LLGLGSILLLQALLLDWREYKIKNGSDEVPTMKTYEVLACEWSWRKG